jgi:enoyl-CoA hydratase/carnithine racemase
LICDRNDFHATRQENSVGKAVSQPLVLVAFPFNETNDVADSRKRKLNFSISGLEIQQSRFNGHRAVKASPAMIQSASRPKNSEAEQPLILRSQDARGVVTLTLNRPQAFNALSEGMLAQLQNELDAIASDESDRVVVIAAEGKAFCAGHDLKEMRADPSLRYYERLFAQCSDVMLTIQRLPLPVIARVQGIATAAGCQLVAMCDLAVASSTARFAVSGVNVGLFCSTPGVALSRNVLRKQAFEMLVTGEFISAQEAKARGLINRVAEPEQLDAELEKLVSAIISKPRVAVAMGKEFFYRQAQLGIAAAYDAASQAMACNMMEEAALEGVQAFIEKRPPRWNKE